MPQPDPEELRRQRETLERICAETSESVFSLRLTSYDTHSLVQAADSRLTTERPP